MRFKIGTIITISFSLFCFTNCEFINPDEQVPSYIQIDSISLEHEKELGITDAWVYVNTELIGVFELPAKIPVLTEGTADIMISAGIKVNGINDTRSYYPFYESYRASKKLKAAESIIINPTIDYDLSFTEFPWKENFEGSGLKFEHSASVKYGFEKVSGNIEGYYCGLIELDSSSNIFNEVSVDAITIPANLSPGYYLEMNFKNDMYFALVLSIYYAGNIDTKYLLYLNPSSKQWKKIYIDLYNPLSSYPSGTKFKISMTDLDFNTKSALEQNLVVNPKVWIDDMKIVQSK